VDLGLKDRTALVTGASQGIGRAVALRLAQEGVRVVLCARRESPLRELAAEIEAAGGAALAVPCDATDHAAPAGVLRQALERFDRIDILVNNVGLAAPRKFLETSDEDWQTGLEINLLSAVRFTRACLPSMIDQRWGRIVNVSSITAKLVDPYQVVYGAGKAALVNFSKTISTAYAAEGICCNCVLPGITRTEMVEANLASSAKRTGRSPEDLMARMLQKAPIPIGRIAESDEIADAIVFLLSSNAGWITGVTLPLDGGTIPVAG
jgi:NAD(P)-dependent dehydrogenase (short-subunit alcohol dehydrogenase family)